MNTQQPDNTNIRKAGRLMIAVSLLIIILMAPGCKKFLATYSQNQTFIETAADLDELLVGEAYNIKGVIAWIDVLDDDLEENPPTLFSGGGAVFNYSGVHHWQPTPFIQTDAIRYSDNIYIPLYKKIAGINTILYNVPAVEGKGESKDTLRRISGEARFLRAYYYWVLANFFGKPYNPSTAGNDYCVPLKTDPAVEDKPFSRNTVKQVYDQIVDDLLTSEKQLQGFNQQSRHRVNQACAQALLSRVYLYMGDYQNAISWADKAMAQTRYRLTNLNVYSPGTPVIQAASPETIFSMPIAGESTFNILMAPANSTSRKDNFKVSADLIQTYSPEDLRLSTFFETSALGEVMARKAGVITNVQEEFMVRLPEVFLNKAEALAILGRDADAATAVQELRKNRFKPEHLTAVTQTGAALVNFIREERRRELCFEMLRWFDLRRYGVNDRFPFGKTIRHTSYAYNSSGRFIQGYFELKPYDQDKAAYVMPIPDTEIEFNNGAIANEPRPERPLIR
jgi:tetratricopeptide (TPR) repeat protein